MADKKIKIAIATHQMVMGGIEKSLIELCAQLLCRDMDVTVYLECMGGELFDQLPKEVKKVFIFEKYPSISSIMKKSLSHAKPHAILSATVAYLENLFHGDPVSAWIHTVGYMDKIDESYDYAFAYGAPVSFSVIFVDRLLKADRKFAWIHNDVRRDSLDIRNYAEIFRTFEKIVCVSEMGRKSFLECLPEYLKKTTVFYNFINRRNILNLSEAGMHDDGFSGRKLLTVGRVCFEKGQDIIPSITQRLVKSGYNIRWYCVGDGEKRVALENTIRNTQMEDNVILLGNQNNPYPFFKKADIYVQPSRCEGFGITLSEAKIFSLPIVTTDFDGANEQLSDKETGLIVRFDENEIYNAIVSLLESDKMVERFKQNLRNDKKRCVSDLDELLNKEVAK